MPFDNHHDLRASTGAAKLVAKRPVGRPRDPAKTEAILDAAWTLFLERGVEAVAMEAIAARACVSKATLYSAFADRKTVFEAVLLREMEGIEAAQGLLGAPSQDVPITQLLETFGVGLMRFLASEPAIAFFGPLSADLRRRPSLAQSFWALGPGRTRANLSGLIALGVHRREIDIPDHGEAADLLFGLWQGFSNLQTALGIETDDVRATIASRVRRGVTVFMTLYAEETGRNKSPRTVPTRARLSPSAPPER